MVVFYAVTLMPSTVDKCDSIPATKPKPEKKKKQSHHWQTQHIVIINNAINDTKVFFVCVLVWQISWNLCFYRVQAFRLSLSLTRYLVYIHTISQFYSLLWYPKKKKVYNNRQFSWSFLPFRIVCVWKLTTESNRKVGRTPNATQSNIEIKHNTTNQIEQELLWQRTHLEKNF